MAQGRDECRRHRGAGTEAKCTMCARSCRALAQDDGKAAPRQTPRVADTASGNHGTPPAVVLWSDERRRDWSHPKADEQINEEWCHEVQRSLAELCDRCDWCQTKHTGKCNRCGWTHCMRCLQHTARCEGCDGGLDHRSEVLSGPLQPKCKAGQRIGRNMHNMGRFFISEVTKARYRKMSYPERQPADTRIEFEAWVVKDQDRS